MCRQATCEGRLQRERGFDFAASQSHHLTPLRNVFGPDAVNDSSAENAAYGALENEKTGRASACVVCLSHDSACIACSNTHLAGTRHLQQTACCVSHGHGIDAPMCPGALVLRSQAISTSMTF